MASKKIFTGISNRSRTHKPGSIPDMENLHSRLEMLESNEADQAVLNNQMAEQIQILSESIRIIHLRVNILLTLVVFLSGILILFAVIKLF